MNVPRWLCSRYRSIAEAVLDTAAITASWANATIDNNHFDGGALRTLHHAHAARSVREQPVSRNLLNALLNCLGRVASSKLK